MDKPKKKGFTNLYRRRSYSEILDCGVLLREGSKGGEEKREGVGESWI